MFEVRGTHLDRADLRRCDQDSIRHFVATHKGRLTGDVLDYGAGLQPYKDLVQGQYNPFTPVHVSSTPAGSPVTKDWNHLPGPYDTVLCTQVLQYVPEPTVTIQLFARLLWEREGYLILTYPTNWPEDETSDIHRFTKAGVDRMLAIAGFAVVMHACRGVIKFSDFEMAFGYGVVARMGAK